MKPIQESIEASVAASASKATVAGSAVTTVGWLTSSNFGMWAGIAIGLAGLLVNTFFKFRSDRRANEAHKAYLKSVYHRPSTPEKIEVDE